MKILCISNLYPSYPNQPKQEITYALHNFCKEWVHLGHEVLAISRWDYYPKIFNLLPHARFKRKYKEQALFALDGVKIARITSPKTPRMPYSSSEIEHISEKILTLLRKEGFTPEIIIVHGIFHAQVAIYLKNTVQIPFILGLHQSDLSRIEKMTNPHIILPALQSSDGFAFRSPKIKRQSESLLPEYFKPGQSVLALSGIDETLIASDDLINTKTSKDKISSLITVGSLIPLKNMDILIRAFAQLNRPEIELTIIGDGPERKNLEKISSTLKVSDKIHFRGYLPTEEVNKELKKSDIFVMISSPETFGLVYLEAMASGCITIGTKGEGIEGIIVDGENGFLVQPDINMLSHKLESLLQLSMSERKKILHNARNTVSLLTSVQTAQNYLDYAQKVLSCWNHLKEHR